MSYLRSQPSPQSLVLSPHETDDSPAGRYQSPRTSGGAPFRISSLGPGAHAESVLYSCPLGESGVTWHGVMVHFCVLFCSLFIFSFLFLLFYVTVFLRRYRVLSVRRARQGRKRSALRTRRCFLFSFISIIGTQRVVRTKRGAPAAKKKRRRVTRSGQTFFRYSFPWQGRRRWGIRTANRHVCHSESNDHNHSSSLGARGNPP